MKVTTSILALLVLFLSIHSVCIYGNIEAAKTGQREACIARKSCSTKKTADSEKKACNKKTENKEEDGCGDVCNPFMACNGCAYTLAEKLSLPNIVLSNLSVKTGYKQIGFISGYNADCWHPPEIV